MTDLLLVLHHPHHEVHSHRAGEQCGNPQEATCQRSEPDSEKYNRTQNEKRRRAAEDHCEAPLEPAFLLRCADLGPFDSSSRLRRYWSRLYIFFRHKFSFLVKQSLGTPLALPPISTLNYLPIMSFISLFIMPPPRRIMPLPPIIPAIAALISTRIPFDFFADKTHHSSRTLVSRNEKYV